MELFNLEGKRALVVGGGGDLGFALMEGLVEAGATAVAVDINPNVERLVDSLVKRGFTASHLVVDISNREAIRKSVADAEALLGDSVDILVNSAGIQRRMPSEDFPEQDWDDVIAINLTATFVYSQLVAA